jgi:serine/threonine protein phosphatase PrpC
MGVGGGAPLAPGTRIGDYTVGRLLRDLPGHRLYLAAHAAAAQAGTSGDDDTRYLIADLAADADRGALDMLLQAGLQHPRLLAPRERVTHAGREYLILQGLPASASVPMAGSEGAYLAPTDALKAGAGLADALGYLHRNGYAHRHVALEAILVQDERAYLAGVERAVALGTETGTGAGQADTAAAGLIAEDANALARTLGMLARLGETAIPHESPAQTALREVAQRGATTTFTAPEEVAAACGAALQATPQPIPPSTQDTTGQVQFHVAFASSVGRVRAENQDATATVVFNLFDDAAGAQVPVGVFLVADGMGGEAHGELASRIAARIVPSELLRLYVLPQVVQPAISATEEGAVVPVSPSALAQALAQSVAAANRMIRDMAQHFRQDTGSTLTVLAVAGHQAILAHLGDSRAYLLRDGSMVQLTEDHTLLARLQAMDHPILNDPTFFVPRNFLYRSLGQEQAPPDLLELMLSPGDRLLICSDGLWDEVNDETISRELSGADDPARGARRLVALADEAGGNDNSTALVIFVRAGEPATNSAGQTAGGAG